MGERGEMFKMESSSSGVTSWMRFRRIYQWASCWLNLDRSRRSGWLSDQLVDFLEDYSSVL